MSVESVDAIWADRKTQTRRLVKLEIPADADEVFIWPEGMRPLPHHKNPGLWARKHNTDDDSTDGWIRFIGKCPYGLPGDLLWVRRTRAGKFIWRKAEADLWLCVEFIRPERLQEISDNDVFAEGYPGINHAEPLGLWFVELWDSLNAKRVGCSWEANPWVWCISFRRVEE